MGEGPSGQPPTTAGPPTARLTVQRAPADGLGDQYRITVSLDGERLASLAPGEKVMREIQPGEHRLRGSNTLMRKAVTFRAAPGDEVRFTTRNRPGPGTAIFASFGAGWLYVALEREVAGANAG